MFAELIKSAADILFPLHCLGCGFEGRWICELCALRFSPEGVWECPACHRPSASGRPCAGACAQKSAVSMHAAMGRHEDDLLLTALVRQFKYHGAQKSIQAILPHIRRFVHESVPFFSDVDAVVAVPLHPRRFAERGWNQASVLGHMMGALLHAPAHEALVRTRATRAQATLSRRERLVNVHNAFLCPDADAVRGKTILLIDDVYTTGATMQACAQALLRSGAREVRGFTLLKG